MVYAIFLGHFCWGLVYSPERPILDDRSRAARPGPGGSCVVPEQWVVLLVVLCGAAGCSGGGTSPGCREGSAGKPGVCAGWKLQASCLYRSLSHPCFCSGSERATANLIPSVKQLWTFRFPRQHRKACVTFSAPGCTLGALWTRVVEINLETGSSHRAPGYMGADRPHSLSWELLAGGGLNTDPQGGPPTWPKSVPRPGRLLPL